MTTSEDQQSSPLPKACENCRVRKIRCNRANPCSNCVSSGIDCRPSSKQIEHRPRMIVSNQYERQIERIHERLVDIELALRSGSVPQSASTPRSHTSQPTTNSTSTTTPNQYEGESSFQSQSLRASALAQSLNVKNDGDFSIALDSLKNVVDAKDDDLLASTHRVHFTRPEDRASRPQMEILPADFVIKLLSQVKEKFPICFYNYSFPNDGQLERLCQRAYFPTDSMSLGEMTTMYGMLWYIISEYIVFGNSITKEYDCGKYLDACERNFHRGIETYDLLAEPSFDNTFALMLGAFKAQDEGKVILCWSLSSAAARHLQAMGYHRESALQNDPPALAEKKRHLFWTVYGIEKNIGLNLGRASTFQDWDIDVNMFQVSSDPTVAPWNAGTITFIEWSRVQGQIYEHLYSAAASRKSQAERAKHIDSLSRTLDKLYDDFRKIDPSEAMYKDYFRIFHQTCDVIHHSMNTLLHRAAPNPDDGSEISSKCFEAAKMCLQSHLRNFPIFTSQGEGLIVGYVNWVLLYCSFTPFIVVFLHAIASMSLSDVKLLQDMTASLEPVKALSQVLRRLHDVCRVFARVADITVRSAHQNAALRHPNPALGSYDQQTDSLFFPGVTGHHGFDPGHQLPDIFMQGTAVEPSGSNMNDMSAYFGNWVSSNQPSMDFFSIDFGNNL